MPGATNYIDMDSVQQGRVSTNEDVFKYQAGVYAKAANNEGVKLSIRGSGLNRSPGAHASGLYETLDGLPLTGPGGTPYELKDPLWQSRVEVLRGANGFDQGALALGGALGTIAVIVRQEIVLAIMGGIFVVEALSVMLQVAWFKYTKKRYGEGRRLLKMAPLHHHFEKSGWKETQVVVRFWIITMLLCLVGLSTLKLR